MDADRDLEVRPLADRPAVLAGHPHRGGVTLGKRHIVDHPHLGPDHLAQFLGDPPPHRQQSHGDWFTNCCRACMFPSGSRSAIGWIDLRRPSSIRPADSTRPTAADPAAAPRRTHRQRTPPTHPGAVPPPPTSNRRRCPPPGEITRRNEALLAAGRGLPGRARDERRPRPQLRPARCLGVPSEVASAGAPPHLRMGVGRVPRMDGALRDQAARTLVCARHLTVVCLTS